MGQLCESVDLLPVSPYKETSFLPTLESVAMRRVGGRDTERKTEKERIEEKGVTLASTCALHCNLWD